MAVIEDLLVWLLASYGAVALLLPLATKWLNTPEESSYRPLIHYQILLFNSELYLEGVVRRLSMASSVRGVPICISFVDYGSTDDTLRMMKVFERETLFLIQPELTAQQPVVIDLRRI